ncbi:MAG: hypothetical protein ACM3PZ_03200 [Bacillota bacterium]
MKNVWSVVCKNSIIDGETNSLSLLETLDEININYREELDRKVIKMLPISFHVVTLWFDEKANKERHFQLLVEIYDPEGKVLNSFEQECVMPKDRRRLRATSKINGFGFTDEGKYLVKVKYKEKKEYILVAETPIDITLNKQS